jgi:hypothetical protein
MRWAAAFAVLMALVACATEPSTGVEKIRFDLKKVDANGFEGPPDGKRPVDYQFCVPNDLQTRMAVIELEPAARFESEVAGRAGCTPDEILVHASTDGPNWRGRLNAIAALPYVQSIRRTPFTPVAQP